MVHLRQVHRARQNLGCQDSRCATACVLRQNRLYKYRVALLCCRQPALTTIRTALIMLILYCVSSN